MKVLQINAVNGIRSTGRIVAEVSDYLNKNGHEGYVAYSDGIHLEKSYKIGNSIEKILHALFSRFFGLQAYFSKAGTKKLLAFMDELNPDIVHLHNLHSNYINLRLLLNYLAKNDIPTVITLHDCWFFTGKCTYFTIDACYNWKTECGKCPRLKKDNPSWFLDRTRKMHHDKKNWLTAIPRLAVVGVSDWITNEAKISFLSSANIITRIYNWIDLDKFKPMDTIALRGKLGLHRKFVILGVASAWSNAKGLDKFFDLAGKISSDMAIVLVGGIKSKTIIPANVLHVNETHDIEELAQYYAMADVYLHLSPEETFGKTTAEAMASGTPAIVVNSTASPELIGPGCGYVVEIGDSKTLLSMICKIKTVGKQAYSNACRMHAKSQFDLDRNIVQLLQLYQELAN